MKKRIPSALVFVALGLNACSGEQATNPPPPPPPPPPAPGSWVTGPSIPAARWSSGVAVFRDQVYVAGGFVGNPLNGSREVFRFDPATNSWEQIADLPDDRVDMPLVAADSLYAVGGFFEPGNAPPSPVSSVWLYLPDSDAWVPRASLPMPVGASGVVSVDGQLFTLGGRTGISQSDLSDSILVYDPGTDTWSRTTPLPQPRSDMAVHVIGGLIYAAGGVTADGSLTTRLDIFDPGAGTWSQGANMARARRGFSSAVLGGRLHVFAGQIGIDDVADHEAYDPSTGSWTRFAEIPTARRDAKSGAVGERVYVIGGTAAGNAVALVEIFSLVAT